MRKGQFYLIDAFFAAAILFLGISLLVTDFVSTPDQIQAQSAINDIIVLLYDTPINEISNTYISENYDILDEQYTPIQQAHAWVFNATYTGCGWCMDNATAFLESIVLDPLPVQHGLLVLVNGTEIVNTADAERASFMIVDKQLLITDINFTNIVGPDPMEVSIWA